MFLGRRRRVVAERVFDVCLNVNQLDSIPVTKTSMFVRWDVVNEKLAEPATGRTWSRPVEQGNVVRWNQTFEFTVRIPCHPRDASVLEPCVLRMSLRSERRKKTGFDEQGIVEIDLSEVAGVGRVARSCLVHKSLLNSLLKIYLNVQLKSGDPYYRRPSGRNSLAALAPAPSPLITCGTDSTPSSSIGTDTGFGTTESASPPVVLAISPSSSCPGNLQQAARSPMTDQFTSSLRKNSSQSGAALETSGAVQPPIPRRSADSAVEQYGTQRAPGLQSLSQWRPTTREDSIRLPPGPSISGASGTVRRASSIIDTGSNGVTARNSTMSPRSPHGAVSAAAVLDYLVPEPVQDDVYESMRLLRARDAVPTHILASRVPVSEAIELLFADDALLRRDSTKPVGLSAGANGDGPMLDLESLIETSRMGSLSSALGGRTPSASVPSDSRDLLAGVSR